ncbi:hypothetical protein ROZALSC1DRAFT_27197 [Rozella allomycis CSF55]|uniref:Protein kinase domain-containing protein n=1 Tax=Rozella allomycis (strain CSF55) TaxID=988480 RepID=A0A075AR38_ROZAC|nr:hypothetical protein O9G_001081 [Rozella allomycis CSF55]RKP21396.1 hypothetical protein ROZALSC1DRAFT_27197 [Rozella allomycis CSF55]|eukprot:EPZ31170.1 hypothetical protein O9G_001081 [Rozella allomycis CSF55]
MTLSMAVFICSKPPKSFAKQIKGHSVDIIASRLCRVIKEKTLLKEEEVAITVSGHFNCTSYASKICGPEEADEYFSELAFLVSDWEGVVVEKIITNRKLKNLKVRGWSFQISLFNCAEHERLFGGREYEGKVFLEFSETAIKLPVSIFQDLNELRERFGIVEDSPIELRYNGRRMKGHECKIKSYLSAFLCGYNSGRIIYVFIDQDATEAEEMLSQDNEISLLFSLQDQMLLQSNETASCLNDKIIDCPIEETNGRGLVYLESELQQHRESVIQEYRMAFRNQVEEVKKILPVDVVTKSIELLCGRLSDTNEPTDWLHSFATALNVLDVDPIFLVQSFRALLGTMKRCDMDPHVDYFHRLLDSLYSNVYKKRKPSNSAVSDCHSAGKVLLNMISFVSDDHHQTLSLPLLLVEEKAQRWVESNWKSRNVTWDSYYEKKAAFIRNARNMKVVLNRRNDENPSVFGALMLGEDYGLYQMVRFKGSFMWLLELQKSGFIMGNMTSAYNAICDFLALKIILKKESDQASFLSPMEQLKRISGDPKPTPKRENRVKVLENDNPEIATGNELTPPRDPTVIVSTNKQYNVLGYFHHSRHYPHLFKAKRVTDGLSVVLKRSVHYIIKDETYLRNTIRMSSAPHATPLIDYFWDTGTADISQLGFRCFRVFVFPEMTPLMIEDSLTVSISFELLAKILISMASFVNYVHKVLYLAHSDIHPWNLLVSNNEIFICDFENAMCLGDEIWYPIGKTGFVHNDVEYLNGEAFIYVEEYLDVYSIGATLKFFANMLNDSGLEESLYFLSLSERIMKECKVINLSEVICEVKEKYFKGL